MATTTQSAAPVTTRWQDSAIQWILDQAAAHYRAWLETKDGRRYTRARKQGKSPYRYGYSQPGWIQRASNAAHAGKEETFKALKHAVRQGYAGE